MRRKPKTAEAPEALAGILMKIIEFYIVLHNLVIMIGNYFSL